MPEESIKDPLVSVLLPAYNAENYISEAIRSILEQNYQNFELVIIDDGSADSTVEKISSFKDERIKLIRHSENQKLIRTLNEGLKSVRGKYIIRMDADDKSLPKRLREQVVFLEKNKDIGACGSWIKVMGTGIVGKYPTDPEEMRARLIFGSPIAHPSVAIKSEVVKERDLSFREDFPHAEDYEFWIRFTKYAKIANIPKPLLEYRQHDGQVSLKHREIQIESTLKASIEVLRSFDCVPTEEEKQVHLFIISGYDRRFMPANIINLEAWLDSIYKKAVMSNLYDESSLRKMLAGIWLEASLAMSRGGLPIWKKYLLSPLTKQGFIFDYLTYKLLIKCILRK